MATGMDMKDTTVTKVDQADTCYYLNGVYWLSETCPGGYEEVVTAAHDHQSRCFQDRL
jgi:hypothetical protein